MEIEPAFVRITFTDAENRAFLQDAEARQIQKRPIIENQIHDQRHSMLENEFFGILGEAALGKYLGLTPEYDDSISLAGRKGKKHITHTVPGLFTLKTKFTRTSRFIVDNIKEFQADYGVLVKGTSMTPAEVHIAGYISREEFLKICRREDLGYGPRFTVRINQLRPIHELKSAMPPPVVPPAPEQLGLL